MISNHSPFRAFLLTVWLAFFVSLSAAHGQIRCAELFREYAPTRALSEVSNLRVMTMNVKDLVLKPDPSLPESAALRFAPGMQRQYKTEAEVQRLRDVIEEQNPDLLVVQEATDLQSLRHLVDGPLSGRYKVFLLNGNDGSRINIGFVVKTDLPFQYTVQSHRKTRWHDPAADQVVPVFSRDLPVLEIRTDARQAKPVLVFAGNHAKSQRDRQGDPGSALIRYAQHEAAAAILSGYDSQGVPVILAGDFQVDMRENDKTVQPLRAILTSSFDVAKTSVPAIARITHTFHPGDRPVEGSQLDDILVSKPLRGRVSTAWIPRYRDADGKIMKIAETQAERNRQPSDHYPVVMDLNVQGLFGP